MKCDEFTTLLNSVFDGEVSVETTAVCMDHAEHCPECRSEFDRFSALRDRVIAHAAHVELDHRLDGTIRAQIQKERAKEQSEKRFRLSPWMGLAAAAILIIMVAAILLSSGSTKVRIAQTVDNKKQKVDVPVTVSASAKRLLLADLIAHTNDHIVESYHYTPAQMPALIRDAGFVIQPPALAGWLLADICICGVSENNIPVAHITYTQKKGRQRRTLICYQMLDRQFDARGMHATGSRIETAVVGKLTLAKIADGNLDNVFVSDMPIKSLLAIAERS